MFQEFRRYGRILVTGPMRSGTTICAAMIARDAGKRLVREESLLAMWPYPSDVVLQAPCLLTEAQRLSFAGWFVVVMQRKEEDILASMKKFMGDRMTAEQCVKSVKEQIKRAKDFADWAEKSGPGQRVIYEDLSSHSMWVEDRRDFGPRDIFTPSTKCTLRRVAD